MSLSLYGCAYLLLTLMLTLNVFRVVLFLLLAFHLKK